MDDQQTNDIDDDQVHQTPDDALEPADDIFNPVRDEEKLPEDNDPPAAPADDTTTKPLPEDHPEFDYDHDVHEMYDEGKTGATDVDAHQETETDLNPPRPLDPEA